MIRFYQLFLSPFLGGQCRFYPSCSNYWKLAAKKFGWRHGMILGLRRIFSCHPWHPGGVDLP